MFCHVSQPPVLSVACSRGAHHGGATASVRASGYSGVRLGTVGPRRDDLACLRHTAERRQRRRRPEDASSGRAHPHHAQRAELRPSPAASRCSCGSCSGPRPTCLALVVLDGLGHHRLPRRQAGAPAQPDVQDRRDPRPGRRPALHPGRRHRAWACATSSRGGWRSSCRCATCSCSCLVPFLRTRGYSSLPGALPGQGGHRRACSTPSRCCCWATRPAPWPTWPTSSAGRSRSGASALYWWAGLLYALQVRRLLATSLREGSLRSAAWPVAGGRGRSPRRGRSRQQT